MKIRTAKYIIKEGIVNSYRNKLMSLASITIIILTLSIFGIFLLLTLIVNENTKVLKEQTEIVVFCDYELDDSQIMQVENEIKANAEVSEYKMVTRAQALESMKKSLGENASVLEGEDESFMPVSFVIKLKNPSESGALVEEFKKVEGVNKVRYPQRYVEGISKLIFIIRIVSSIIIAVLLMFSVFIISNTIKLTVFARRKEISIMKYIGATDWFIRWPFIIEGVIIGFIGAIVAYVLLSISYNSIAGSSLLKEMTDVFKLVKINDVGFQIIAINTLIGVVVGALGSMISIRKYLHV